MQTTTNELAILGGSPIRTQPYPWHVTTDQADIKEALRVLESGVLSVFEGANTPYFLGGKDIKALESEWAEAFSCKHAISLNSATSGLMAAVGALGIGPGDEVIVPPWTMSATAAAVLVYNAIPVFCDITEDTFNLDPVALRKCITPYTKAIMVVHIFGHPADMDPILAIAKEHGLAVIEDAAQSPKATYKGRFTGTLGDIGVFSLNSNKIIQCGEGGVAVTNDDELALRLRLIRNHAEAAIATGIEVKSLVNMLGWNYRMNEVEAAISRVQLRKLDSLLKARRVLVDYLNKRLSTLRGLLIPPVKPGCTHTYYRYPLKLDRRVIPVNAATFTRVLNAEGMDFSPGYRPLYLQPLYQQRIVYGDKGCPFTCQYYKGHVSYEKGICPIAEALSDSVISTEVVRPPLTLKDIDQIYEAFAKVLANQEKLVQAEAILEKVN